jgi:hypothetical protein
MLCRCDGGVQARSVADVVPPEMLQSTCQLFKLLPLAWLIFDT